MRRVKGRQRVSHAYERWDGKGFPAGLEGEAIPLAVRVVVVARDADLATMLGDDPHEWMSERRGRAYDPSVVEAFEGVGPDVLSELSAPTVVTGSGSAARAVSHSSPPSSKSCPPGRRC